MTDQERQMIEALAKRIQDATAPQIDRDADDLIRRAIGARTDALYILSQTVLIQEMALTQAKAQIDELKQRVPSAGAGSSGFLGSTSAERAPQPAGWAEETGVQRPGGYRRRRVLRFSPQCRDYSRRCCGGGTRVFESGFYHRPPLWRLLWWRWRFFR